MVWQLLGRLNFSRAVKSHTTPNHSERIEVHLISEFTQNDHEKENNFLFDDQWIFHLKILQISSSPSSTIITYPSSYEVISGPFSSSNSLSNNTHKRIIFQIITPKLCGSYQYLITPSHIPDGYLILPLLSSPIQVVETIPWNWNILCATYRPLHFPFGDDFENILIKEDRGLTMGSHLWDSSLVLFLNFSLIIQPLLDTLGHLNQINVVELGAGCSLLGIAVASYLSKSHHPSPHVYCTDLASQIPLIRENIAINHLKEEHITAHELDWSSQENLNTFQHILLTDTTNTVDIILAADVLYQSDMTTHFFHTLSSLATPEHTIILLAQKIRFNSSGTTSRELVDLSQYSEYHSTILHEEANVIIWLLKLRNIENIGGKEC